MKNLSLATMVASAICMLMLAGAYQPVVLPTEDAIAPTPIQASQSASVSVMAIVCPQPFVSVTIAGPDCETFVNIPIPTSNDMACPITSQSNTTGMMDPSGIYPDTMFTITYTVEDACGAMMTCNQIIIVMDDTAPDLRAPNDTIVVCAASDIAAATSVAELILQGGSISDFCEIDSQSFVALPDMLVSSDGCTKVFDRSYQVSDVFGNQALATQTIIAMDTIDPIIFTCPADVTTMVTDTTCSIDVIIEPLIANDNCGVAAITNSYNNTADASDNYPLGITVITWTVTDSCSNSATCFTTVRVNDLAPPSFDLVDTLFAQCDASEVPLYTDPAQVISDGGVAVDQCGPPVFLSFISETTDGASCPETVTRTYQLTDNSNPPNEAFASHIILVQESVPPTFTPPAAITLDCTADLDDLMVTGNISGYSDNCGGSAFSIDYSDTAMVGSCPGEHIITRTFAVTDSCGNTATGTQTITTTDNTPPVAQCFTLDTVYLGPLGEVTLDLADLDSASFDLCSDTLIYSTNIGTTFFCNGVNNPMLFILTIDDGCGNTAMCDVTVLLLDTLSPVVTCPPNDTIQCITDVADPFVDFAAFMTAGGTYNDNCDNNMVPDFQLINQTFPTSGPCPLTVSRTYQLSDSEGNDGNCTHNIVIDDQTPPTLSPIADIVINGVQSDCDTSLIIPMPTVMDGCSNGLVLTNSFNGTDDASDSYSLGMTTVTFYATDFCGNVDSISFDVIINGNANVVCTPDTTVSCSLDEVPPYADIDEFLDAGGTFIVDCAIDSSSFTLIDEDTLQNTTCNLTVARTYGLNQNGITLNCQQIITVQDTIDPVIMNNTPLVVSSVGIDICTATIPSITIAAMDNCTDVTITNDYNGTADAGDVYNLDSTLVTWTVTDACGNTATSATLVVIGDNQNPMINCPVAPLAQCSISEIDTLTSYSAFVTNGGSASDNCTVDTSTFTHVGDIQIIILGLPITERIYRIADIDGNEGTCFQMLLAIDNTPPVFTNCPDTTTVSALTDCDAQVTLMVAATDNCGLDTIYNDFNGGGADATGTYPLGFTTVTFTAEDLMGNTSTCQAVVQVLDGMNPTIICPDSTFVQCDSSEAPLFASLNDFESAGGSVSDSCGIAAFAYLYSTSTGSCPQYVDRVYQVTDESGNTATCTHTVVVFDTIAPVVNTSISPVLLSASADSCGVTATVDTTGFGVTDNCGLLSVTNSFGGGSNHTQFFAEGTTDVVFTITDSCGNFVDVTLSVIVTDDVDPMILCPLDTQAICDISEFPEALTLDDFIIQGGSASDACGLDSMSISVNTININTSPTTSCVENWSRTYTIFDVNGNSANCLQSIVVQDTIAPTVTTLDTIVWYTNTDTCGTSRLLPQPVFMDNCGIDTIYNDLDVASDSLFAFDVDTTTVLWTAEDSCGFEISTEVVIIVLDTIAPQVSDPDTAMAQCNESEVPFFQSFAELTSQGGSVLDVCGLDTILFIGVIPGPVPNSFSRDYLVTDIYGNSSIVTQIIVVMDDIDPVIEAPVDVTIDCDASMDTADIGGIIVSMDNCGVIDTAVMDTLIDADPCNMVIWRVFTISDAMGNSAADTQVITKIDTVPPSFDIAGSALTNIACDGIYPSLPAYHVSDNCDMAPVVTLDTIVTGSICAGMNISIVVTATDQCSNSSDITFTFEVAPDTTAPVLATPLDTVRLETGVDSCSVTFRLPIPALIDDCSTTTALFLRGSNTYPLDTTIVQWRIVDQCGNDDTVEQVVIVEDLQAPTFTCESPQSINLNQSKPVLVPADAFVDDLFDNCTKVSGLIVQGMRVDADGNPIAPCGDAGNAMLRDSVSFCCEELEDTVYVMITVSDLRGNSTSCTVTSVVKDKMAPQVVVPLPNILITCEYPLDLTDLSAFGKLVFDPNDRDSIFVDDFFYQPNSNYAGLDGWINDNCPDSTMITESLINNLNRCNQGTITRVFTINDGFNPPVTTTQTITIQDINPIVRADITFPGTYFHGDCKNPHVDPSISGVPIIANTDKCSDVGYYHQDLLFNNVLSGCPTVQRTWTVIDWCQYSTSNPNGPGRWEEIQMIKVIDTIAPVFSTTTVSDTFCTVLDECDVLVQLSTDATDSCTDPEDIRYSYAVDTDGNGTFDQFGLGKTYSRRFDFGTYRIRWTADDGCGNSTQQIVTFVTSDCKPPQAVCKSGLSISLNSTGTADIWASDINQYSSDNCTHQSNLLLSLSSNTQNTSTIFTCDHVGIQPLQLWVTDAFGNQAYCTTQIDVQDNFGVCNINKQSANVGGKILGIDQQPLVGVDVLLEGPEMELRLTTDNTGTYHFDDLVTRFDYAVTPILDRDHAKGVSTLDLVLIQRHILGLQPLATPQSLIAADIDNNERISGSDVVQLRRLILEMDDRFSDNQSYRFVDAAFTFDDPAYPWPFKESIELAYLLDDDMQQGFQGIKIGDVSGVTSVQQGHLEGRSANVAILYAEDQAFVQGDLITVPVAAASWLDIMAGQWKMTFDNDALSFIRAESELLPNFHTHEVEKGQINMLFYDTVGSTLGDETPVLMLTFRALKSGQLNDYLDVISNQNTAKAYDGSRSELVLEDRDIQAIKGVLHVGQNTPNPFNSFTEIPFDLNTNADVEISLYDGGGKHIYTHNGIYEAGTHRYRVSANQIDPNVGVLYYTVKVGPRSFTKKMIRIE